MSQASFAIKLRKVVCAAIVLVPLGGCTTDRIVDSSISIDDYKNRHPILIAEDRTSIDVFPVMAEGRLDRHTAKQIYAFAVQYRDLGRGPILVLVPRDRSGADRVKVAEIRHILAKGGAREVDVSSYPIGNAALASPIRLSYAGLKAKVADQCGQWPRDLASGSTVDGWQNQTYWNFGCANQNMIATQTSDPRDLVTPRGEEPSDVLMRSRAIEDVRKGTDPNTSWTVKNSNIGSVGGG